MPKIRALYAYVMADADENDEGVPAVLIGENWMPLMGADIDRVASMRVMAQDLANRSQKSLTLVRSTSIETVEVVKPNAEI